MALDGIVIANIVHELKSTLTGGRINKISQPEKEELLITIKGQDKNLYKLFLSAGAGMPLIYLTENTKANPLTAPNFCMLLRKYLNNGKILDVIQPGLERIVMIKLEHMDELGDLKIKYLIIELMGKHSNIILCDDKMTIIDSIKRVNQFMSSVREVLPGREYFTVLTAEKLDPFTTDYPAFRENVLTKMQPIGKAIYTGITGISPLIANEICHRASIDPGASTSTLNEDTGYHLYRNFERIMQMVKDKDFSPHIIIGEQGPVEFSSIPLTSYSGSNYEVKSFKSPSGMLESYYASKNAVSVMKQKSADLRKLVANAIERNVKKYDLQLKQLNDTQDRDKYKIYGELITAYGYNLEPGAKELTALNYYNNNEEIRIPLDPLLTPMENAKRYFEKYNKMKRTYEALSALTEETRDEINHLKSIQNSLEIATDEVDLADVKHELMEYGYIKKKSADKKPVSSKNPGKSRPFHYLSSDGYHIYVGKNNYQNEELTFRLADKEDWWFHSKNYPGSHVIVKTGGDELPDSTFEEAARLAAYYSSARDAKKVEIDYTQIKNIKKPKGSKPGFVIYYTYYSMMADTDISGINIAN